MPSLSPGGHLTLVESAEAQPLEAARAARLVDAFAKGSGHGLLILGATEVGTVLPADLGYWRDLGARYVAARCGEGQGNHAGKVAPALGADVARSLADAGPPMAGAETLTGERIESLWADVHAAFELARREAKVPLETFLHGLNPAWNVVGRVHFHLAENRRDDATPFAFLATYTTGLAADGRPRHVRLERALTEFAGAAKREALLALLGPVQRAGAACLWLREMIDRGDVYHPIRWSAVEALRFLRDAQKLEAAGVILRMPAAWKVGRPPRPRVTASVGEAAPVGLGAGAILDFEMSVVLEGEKLTRAEIQSLLAQSSGLAMIRGQWVEVDGERLASTLARFREIERATRAHGLSFREAARMLAGADASEDGTDDAATRAWSEVVAGDWMARTLAELRSPATIEGTPVGLGLEGTLRPYQEVGVRWLHLLSRLGLGACLADDMGLGKTIQVLALLLLRKRERKGERRASLLVAPASLLANWEAEAARFAPSLRTLVVHGSALPKAERAALDPARFSEFDLVVTSYGQVQRVPSMERTSWDLAVLDEAQAIKNPSVRQARAVKLLRAQARIALTGTPIENRLGDLWSIFDFLNPGLLGSAPEFASFLRRMTAREHDAYAPLRDLVRPYVLRRLKTDRTVISDLPEKTEVTAFCGLSKRQIALYKEAVDDLKAALKEKAGIARRGTVLASILRLKQICNHPSQWLGDGAWAEAESGKWARLREIAEVVAAKQEKVLVFSQFREVTGPLAAFLGGVFGREGLVLHGGTPVGARRELVQRFQTDEQVPFFVLSLKAGGTGLNLTAASHVVHFDRWWNPAVESQATDRAYRIGQTKNVLVHKFVCRGSIEEKIDDLVEAKRGLARDVLEGGPDVLLTEMSDAELLRVVALDVHRAAEET